MASVITETSPAPTVTRPVRPLARRAFFWPYLIFSALCFIPLYFFSGKTATGFAVTFGSPLSAAAVGAGFAAAITMIASTLPERDWTGARGTLFAPVTLLLPMLVVTLAAWSDLRFSHAPGLVTAFTWLWVAAYLAAPALALTVWRAHRSPAAEDPPRTAPMGADVKIPTLIMGVVLTGLAVALWAAPHWMGAHWAWPLTPIDARVLGCWFFAFGMGAYQAVWEQDLHRMRAGFFTDVTLATLSLLAMLRYHDQVRWSQPLTWTYLVILAGLITAGITGRFLALPEALARGRGEDPHKH